MELGTYFNLNMLNSMPIFICFVLEQKYTFMGKFGQKNQVLYIFNYDIWRLQNEMNVDKVDDLKR